MSTVFWIATIIMAVLAFAFAAYPLLQERRKPPLLLLGVGMPALAATLYLFVGSPSLIAFAAPPAEHKQSIARKEAPTKNSNAGSIASLVDGLVAKLDQNPDDGENWLLLARSYEYLGRDADAASAYERATELGVTDAELAERLRTETREQIATGPGIRVNVALSGEAQTLVQPTDIVFIFARGADSAGAPAAVLRTRVSELPASFSLNDTHSMAAGNRLSDHERVIVAAKVSRSGSAANTLQGLGAKSAPVPVASADSIVLVIR